MWVVKLGGSLWNSKELRRWLAGLAEPATVARLIVPGGGPFADTVRHVQPILGFGEITAHRMAILAMEQYGLALLDLEPELATVRSAAEAAALGSSGQGKGGGVWLPASMTLVEPELKASWEVTSDSIALWLAARFGAAGVVLVKSAALPAGKVTAASLAAQGLVDRSFTLYAGRFAGPIHLVSRYEPFWSASGRIPASGVRVEN